MHAQQVYFHVTQATDPEVMRTVLEAVRNIVMRQNLARLGLTLGLVHMVPGNWGLPRESHASHVDCLAQFPVKGFHPSDLSLCQLVNFVLHALQLHAVS